MHKGSVVKKEPNSKEAQGEKKSFFMLSPLKKQEPKNGGSIKWESNTCIWNVNKHV